MSDLSRISSAKQRQQLLRFARETAGRALGVPGDGEVEAPRIAGTFGGVFVTFWRGKALRGCVGTFSPTDDVAATVARMTKASLRDSRFAGNPIKAAELPKLLIEISVLSTPERTSDPASLIPGVHGVVIRRGAQSGCFLPKVASDRGWSAEEFLSHCCAMKAGLDRDAWRDAETEVELFEADVICEPETASSDTR